MTTTKRTTRFSWMAHISAIALSTVLFYGCSNWKPGNIGNLIPDKSTNENRPTVGRPKLEVAGQNLGESQEVSITSHELQSSVDELVGAKRFTTANRYLARHPEAVLETLRRNGGAKSDRHLILIMAQAHDRQYSRSNKKPYWTNLIEARTASPEKFKRYDEARIEFQSLMTQGKADRVLHIDLPKLANEIGEPLLLIDAWQLRGTALLMNEKVKESIVAFKSALTLAEPISDYQSAYLLLMLSDVQRRAGDSETAADTWRKAVDLTTTMITSNRSIFDPVLWERLAYQRPVELVWPAATVRRWNEIDPVPGLDLSTLTQPNSNEKAPDQAVAETLLWNCVGTWYLDRGQHQAGLVAIKRAESLATDSRAQHHLRLRQARALILLDQTGPATAILVALVAEKNNSVTNPATAMLGSLRLQASQLQQGLSLLKKAVEKNESQDWAERGQAEADLGLAYLMMGDDKNGMRWLHHAQHRFESHHDFESYALSLHNEAKYLTQIKKKSEAEKIREKLLDIERSGSMN